MSEMISECLYPADPAAPPSPAIQASSDTVAVGQNLKVTCTVIGEQDVVVDFTWEYPGQKVWLRHTTYENINKNDIKLNDISIIENTCF